MRLNVPKHHRGISYHPMSQQNAVKKNIKSPVIWRVLGPCSSDCQYLAWTVWIASQTRSPHGRLVQRNSWRSRQNLQHDCGTPMRRQLLGNLWLSRLTGIFMPGLFSFEAVRNIQKNPNDSKSSSYGFKLPTYIFPWSDPGHICPPSPQHASRRGERVAHASRLPRMRTFSTSLEVQGGSK